MKQLYRAIIATIVLALITGIVYPLVVTGIAKVVFPQQARGSLLEKNNQIIGAKLIGQNFSAPQYFHPRPSAAGKDGYDATASGGSNLGPTNKKLIAGIKDNIKKVQQENPGINVDQIPIDMVTASASGLDPHISPAAAMIQVPRVAKARKLEESIIRNLVDKYTEGRQLGVLGEPRVNVLLLNMALDNMNQ